MSEFPFDMLYGALSNQVVASTFVIAAEDHGEIPPPLISFVRLLLLQPEDWEKAKEKQKFPKPKFTEEDGSSVLGVINHGLRKRLDEFPSPIEVIASGARPGDVKLIHLSGRLGPPFEPRSSFEETKRGRRSGRGKAYSVRDAEQAQPTATNERIKKAEAVGSRGAETEEI